MNSATLLSIRIFLDIYFTLETSCGTEYLRWSPARLMETKIYMLSNSFLSPHEMTKFYAQQFCVWFGSNGMNETKPSEPVAAITMNRRTEQQQHPTPNDICLIIIFNARHAKSVSLSFCPERMPQHISAVFLFIYFCLTFALRSPVLVFIHLMSSFRFWIRKLEKNVSLCSGLRFQWSDSIKL